MTKYHKYERRTPEAAHKIHPIWTGIGCVMIIIVPIMSGAAAQLLVDFARTQPWPFMNSLYGYARFPDSVYTTPILSTAANYISGIPNLYALTLFFVVIVLILSGVLSFAYAVVYRVIGPPRYTSQDAPAQRVTTKHYTR